MPTMIALDVSLSMRRPVPSATITDNLPSEQLTRHHLALQGINVLLNYLQANSKLEFVSLVIIIFYIYLIYLILFINAFICIYFISRRTIVKI